MHTCGRLATEKVQQAKVAVAVQKIGGGGGGAAVGGEERGGCDFGGDGWLRLRRRRRQLLVEVGAVAVRRLAEQPQRVGGRVAHEDHAVGCQRLAGDGLQVRAHRAPLVNMIRRKRKHCAQDGPTAQSVADFRRIARTSSRTTNGDR
ncbi:hypothetical protein V9T40_014731 [Parthenolecanium corni]|uniref:Uncharacterized protein n=1 Tax=Parthenolecanium corni TaxID=536013 RepID=A0AAN9T6A6_9HEMI